MEFLTAMGNWFCGYGPGYGHGGHGLSAWMPFHFGGWFNILIIGLLIFLAVKLFNRRREPAHQHIALDVIKRRYAEGEIDHDTYVRLRDELRK